MRSGDDGDPRVKGLSACKMSGIRIQEDSEALAILGFVANAILSFPTQASCCRVNEKAAL